MVKLDDIAPQNKNTRACSQGLYLYTYMAQLATRIPVSSVHGQNMREVRDKNFPFFFLSRPLKEYPSQELYCFQLHFKITNFHFYNTNGLGFLRQ